MIELGWRGGLCREEEMGMDVNVLLGFSFLMREVRSEPNCCAESEQRMHTAPDFLAKYTASSAGKATVIGTIAAPSANAATTATVYSYPPGARMAIYTSCLSSSFCRISGVR